jgi:uncharacterized protein YecT (DUF1311 family)
MMLGASATYAGSETALVPQKWSPDIDVQTISEWSEAALKGPSGDIPQQGLNRYLAMLADVWDSKLMLAYIQLSAHLSVADKETLVKEQTIWLARREANASGAAKSEASGSDAPATYSQTYIDLTKRRYQEILDRLKSK